MPPVLAYFAWPLAFVLLPLLLLVVFSTFFAGRQQDRLGRELCVQLEEVNADTVDSVQGLKEIVAFLRGPQQRAALHTYGCVSIRCVCAS